MKPPSDLLADGIRLTWVWRGDRYGHRIDLIAEDTLIPILESIEGAADDAADRWPPSPPLADIHVEQRPDGSRAALSVGLACGAHFSAAVSLTAPSTLRFEMACRARERPSSIGSCYRLLVPQESIDRDCLRIAPRWKLLWDGINTHARLNEARDAISIKPIEPTGATWPRTSEWGYWLERDS